ncbi:tail completion protein gp17 [Sphingomonas mucosissima]|uniref:DUF3168 domain-containing protein n=1 Tax=Sphingomonas mucosissima TaxID=370959 RepID=A0A245ZGQ1_9SPHN|nr:DUF3168 domain-containing protein [Sphingomonas mucosissima]OWK28914.1 hypothetical protein SPMU_24390 [Sphingomonas mucosissima]
MIEEAMSGADPGGALQAALVAAVRDVLTTFDAPPVRAALPYAVVEDAVLARWGGVGIDGREGRVRIVLHDAGERPVRLRVLAAQAEEAVAALSGEIGAGWRVVALRLVRARIVKSGGGDRWTATSEFAVTIYRER